MGIAFGPLKSCTVLPAAWLGPGFAVRVPISAVVKAVEQRIPSQTFDDC